jgi:RNA polymerase sigma factor (sigma-70 family)
MAEFRELTDEDVVAAVGGSRDHIERIAETVRPRLHLMVTARLSPTRAQHHDVEDLIQMCSMAVTSGLPQLANRTVGGLKAYTSVIVSRKVADYIAARRDGPRRQAPASLDSTMLQGTSAGPVWQLLSASGTMPPSAAGRADELAAVLNELAALSPQEREIINLAFFDELTTEQMGSVLGISRGAASMRLLRAVRALRARMQSRPIARANP